MAPELRCDRFDLLPGFERPLLFRAPRRVWDAALGRVVVDKASGDGAVEDLAKRLRRLVPVPLRNCQPPRVHVLGVSSASRTSLSVAVVLPSSQRSFAIVTRSA